MIIWRPRQLVVAPPGLILKAEGPIRPQTDDWWKRLHAIAAAGEPEVRRAFLDAVEQAVGAADARLIQAALMRGDVDAALLAIPLNLFEQVFSAAVQQVAIEAAVAAAEAAAGGLAGAPVLELSFNLGNPRAVEWAMRHAAELVREVTDETRAAIREVIVRMLEEGGHPFGARADIQEILRASAEHVKGLAGLTRREAAAIDRYRQTLIAQEVKPERIERLVGQRYRKALKRRAERIARTEGINAAASGQREQWREALAQGLLDPGEWEREWVAIVPDPDNRTCPICEALDGKRAPINGVYLLDGKEYDGPTAHPLCRCAEKLVRVATVAAA